jgi:phosphohistidine phosphatase
MRSLTLIRHAKASSDHSAPTDFDRPLTERGLRDAPLMAQRFAHGTGFPLQLVSSPAVRAFATAIIFAEALDAEIDAIRREPAIYEAGVADLLKIVHGLDDEQPYAALFGHNPGLTDFCHRLARCDFSEMSPCAIVRIDFDVDRWQDVALGEGRMMAYSFPKERQ